MSLPFTVSPRVDPGVAPLADLLASATKFEEKPDGLWSAQDLEDWTRRQNIDGASLALSFLRSHVLPQGQRDNGSLDAVFTRQVVGAVRPVRTVEGVALWSRDWLKELFLRTHALERGRVSDPTVAEAEGHKGRMKALLDVIERGQQS